MRIGKEERFEYFQSIEIMKRILFYSLIFLLVSCSNKYQRFVGNYTFKSVDGKPDYSNLDYWAAHPYKHDPSDSVSKPLKRDYHPDSSVDVFFIHPTTYTDAAKSSGWNAPIDSALLNAKTDYSTILYQASIFNEAGRVFAPRYRQANYWSYFPITKEDSLNAFESFEKAYNDIKKAFEYYLEHWNKGRPIIIASHSQGTTHAKRLLKEFFEGKELQKKLVIAYIIGIPVEEKYFSSLKPCNNPDQTGCYCSWRTFKQNYESDYVKKETEKIHVTNPITWSDSEPLADRSQNKGSVLLNFNKLYKNVADANIHNGILWTRKPKFFGKVFYKTKNYHAADLNLYYLSIRENVKRRIKK